MNRTQRQSLVRSRQSMSQPSHPNRSSRYREPNFRAMPLNHRIRQSLQSSPPAAVLTIQEARALALAVSLSRTQPWKRQSPSSTSIRWLSAGCTGSTSHSWLYNNLHLKLQLAKGLGYHFLFMWFFVLNGMAYVLYTFFTGEWRELVPTRRSFREATQVILDDLGVSKRHPPQRKFNGAQQIAYTAVILMGASSLLTGLAIYKPTQLHTITALLGGYEMARWLHFLLTIGYVGFFLVHVTQVIRAGWNNFRAMIVGYLISPGERAEHDEQSL